MVLTNPETGAFESLWETAAPLRFWPRRTRNRLQGLKADFADNRGSRRPAPSASLENGQARLYYALQVCFTSRTSWWVKPASLSYQMTTLSMVSFMTEVRGPSTTPPWVSPR